MRKINQNSGIVNFIAVFFTKKLKLFIIPLLQMFATELLKAGVEQVQKTHFHLIFTTKQPQ
jgi:hypothetical protein